MKLTSGQDRRTRNIVTFLHFVNWKQKGEQKEAEEEGEEQEEEKEEEEEESRDGISDICLWRPVEQQSQKNLKSIPKCQNL